MMPKKRKSTAALRKHAPECAIGPIASRNRPAVHPNHPNIVDAPPDTYGKAFVIGGIRSAKQKMPT
jgi:hypothetical protein